MRKKIIKLASDFWGVPISQIVDSFAFDDKHIDGNISSVRFFQFIAAIESNFDVKVKDTHKIRTFEDLMHSIEEK